MKTLPSTLVFKGTQYRLAEKPTWTEDTVKEVGTQLGIAWEEAEFDDKAFLEGMNVELEHGTVNPGTNITDDDPEKTAKIAWAHLLEDPDYYTKLKKLEEGKAKKDGSARFYSNRRVVGTDQTMGQQVEFRVYGVGDTPEDPTNNKNVVRFFKELQEFLTSKKLEFVTTKPVTKKDKDGDTYVGLVITFKLDANTDTVLEEVWDFQDEFQPDIHLRIFKLKKVKYELRDESDMYFAHTKKAVMRNPPSASSRSEAKAQKFDKFLTSMRRYLILMKVWNDDYRRAGTYWSEKNLFQARTAEWPKLFELLAVYHTISSLGPDVNAMKLKRYLPSIRASVPNGDILSAFENGDQLDGALARLGLLGAGSDELRDPADKYY